MAKGLKVPCLFMITEVSIRCQKNRKLVYGVYPRIPPNTPLLTTPSHLKYVARLPCNLPLITFSDINVSQGSVATFGRSGGILYKPVYYKFTEESSGEIFFVNRLRFDRIMDGHESAASLFWPTPCTDRIRSVRAADSVRYRVVCESSRRRLD